jgi:hypothetical protein
MRNDSFYTTVAQVLPTLFIAFALELISFRRTAQEAGHTLTEEEIQRRLASGDLIFNPAAIVIFLVGALVFLGETCAVLVLLTGTDTWFPIIAGPFCAIAVVAVTLLVGWMFWVRLVQGKV